MGQFGFTPEILEWFTNKGCEWIKLELEPGDLVVWDSRTAHYNVPPLGDRDRVAACKSDRFAGCISGSKTCSNTADTCYAPAALCEPEQLAIKKKMFADRKMSVSASCP